MTADEFEAFLRGLGLTVEAMTGNDNASYMVVRDFTIPAGSLHARKCDIAVLRTTSTPYIPPAAIHVRPALLPMGGPPFAAQGSGIGPEWQYLSRRFDKVPTPKNLWTHILTVLCDDQWPTS